MSPCRLPMSVRASQSHLDALAYLAATPPDWPSAVPEEPWRLICSEDSVATLKPPEACTPPLSFFASAEVAVSTNSAARPAANMVQHWVANGGVAVGKKQNL